MTAAGMAGGFTPANTVPLRVKAGGARLEQRMQGWQHAWLQTSAQHFARRTLAKAEMDAFLGMHCHTHDERMRFLATRYASYKLTT